MNLKAIVAATTISVSALLSSSHESNAAALRNLSLYSSPPITPDIKDTRKESPTAPYKTIVETAAYSALMIYIIRKKNQKTSDKPNN